VVHASGVQDFNHAYRLVAVDADGNEIVSNPIRVMSKDTRCRRWNQVKMCVLRPDGTRVELCVNFLLVDWILHIRPGSYLGPCEPDFAGLMPYVPDEFDAIEDEEDFFAFDPGVNLDEALGNEVIDRVASFNVYPNPTNSELFIDYMTYNSADTRIELYDSQGQLVTEVFSGRAVAEENISLKLDLSTYSDGIYLVRVINSDGIQNKKVILAR
jgi:hypothetical protein